MIHSVQPTANDVFMSVLGHKKQVTKVLIIGNNPLEIAEIYDNLSDSRKKHYMVDVSFNLKDGKKRALQGNPDVILLDDNLDYKGMSDFTKEIKNNPKYINLKLILMKTSNQKHFLLDQVEDYLLKTAINTEILDKVISNHMPVRTHQLA